LPIPFLFREERDCDQVEPCHTSPADGLATTAYAVLLVAMLSACAEVAIRSLDRRLALNLPDPVAHARSDMRDTSVSP
jgi:hypothetical protein